jgi:hypothetical protein
MLTEHPPENRAPAYRLKKRVEMFIVWWRIK